jgi:hypothetical protein
VIVDVPAFGTGATTPGGGDGPRDRGRVHLAWGLGAGGGALTAGGVVVGLVARANYQHEFTVGNCAHDDAGHSVCNSTGLTNQRNAITLANVGTGVGVAGIALGAAAVIVYLTAPHEVVVVPTANGVALSGRF